MGGLRGSYGSDSSYTDTPYLIEIFQRRVVRSMEPSRCSSFSDSWTVQTSIIARSASRKQKVDLYSNDLRNSSNELHSKKKHMDNDQEITVRILVNDRVIKYQADYHTLHNNEWNEIIRQALDDEHFNPGGKSTEVNL